MKKEISSNITGIRAIEDSIRATRKYTEGIGTLRKKHPIQGEEFPSKVFCKFYEVYPETELSWDMPAGVAIDLLWGEVPRVDVTFKYDYRSNRASVLIQDGPTGIRELANNIPGFGDALRVAETNGSIGRSEQAN